MAEERQCMCTTPEITIKLNKQGPQGKVGPQGEPGFSPYIGVANDTPSQYILKITNEDGEYLTPNLKANVPLGGGTGDVLTKNSNVDGDCSFKALPYASTSQQGVVYLATTEEALLGDPDYAITGEVLLGVLANKIGNGTITLTQGGVTKGTFTTNQAGNTSIALDGTPANMVTTDTNQEISGIKTFTKGIKLPSVYGTIDVLHRGLNYTIFGSTEGQGNTLISLIGNNYNGNRTQIYGSYIDLLTSDNRPPRTYRNGQYYDIIDTGSIGSYSSTYTAGDPLYIDTGNVIKLNYDSGKGLYVSGRSLAVRVDGTTVDFDNSGNLTVVGGGSAPTNMVTTDTTQTITGRKTFDVIDANNVVTSSVSVPIGYSSFTLTGGANSDTIYLGTSAGIFNNGYLYAYNTQIGTDDVCIRTNYANNKVLLKATNVSIERNSTEYTNIDSGNIGSYIPTINGGNANA